VEQLARHFRLDLTKVPYRGTAPQVTDLVAGHVQIGTADFVTAAPHFRDGRLQPCWSSAGGACRNCRTSQRVLKSA
jgi:tripartite-type tricarboxylate transporter receptor subunit TctC